ncbi:M48 family metalloprotease [Streptomyces sp. NPDC037389]|uniref:M48 family metalloprotease n=1 Tax=Streptomyces sp. NPDC037389 TaxID=3155369 RepID=UPI0033C3882D
MTTTPSRIRVDERVMGAGTTVRFVLLMVLLLVSCWNVMGGITRRAALRTGFDHFGCLFAAGGNPFGGDVARDVVAIDLQGPAYQACLDRYEPPLAWWVTLSWPVLLVVVAWALFQAVPAWRTRRGRVVPLAAVDPDGGILRLVEELAAVAGLTRVPRVVVDPAAASTGAVVLGSDRRPTVCLHGGLLARRHTDPEGFRAVLLHEFAHIRNRDVTLTYVTLAVWWAFVAVVLLPALAVHIKSALAIAPKFQAVQVPSAVRGFGLLGLLVVLVYLARADVLRSREIYADRAAVRWGADPRGWAVATAGPPPGAWRRAAGTVAELWHTHPRWDLRRKSLDDPVVLFGVQALPLFLTGAAATLINSQASEEASAVNAQWVNHVRVLASAALIVGVLGVALWRGVAHAVLTSRRVPSGVRAGLWLGAGMAVGELVVNDVTSFTWLPARPWVLVLVVLAGGVFAWWATQCAYLWVRVWPGRTIRPAMLLGLASMCLVLSAWFEWWQASGKLYAGGAPFDTGGFIQSSGLASIADTYRSLPAKVLVELSAVAGRPLALPAVAALWVVPLLAWAMGPSGTPPTWMRDAIGGGAVAARGEGVPPLRRVFLAVLLGGASACAALVGVMAFLHDRRATADPPAFVVTYCGWLLVALGTAAAVAAVAASAPARRYRLLVALVAAEAAVLTGCAGTFTLASFDGCVQPLNTLVHTCGWHPGVPRPLFQLLLGPALLLGAVVAVVVAVAVSVAATVRRRPASRDAAVRRSVPPARRAVAVGLLCAVAVGATVAAGIFRAEGSQGRDDRARSRPSAVFPGRGEAVGGSAGPSVSARTREIQVLSWYIYGGEELLRKRFMPGTTGFFDLLTKGRGEVSGARVRPFCEDFARIARDAGAFFRVPDARAEGLWKEFTAGVEKTGRTCGQAVEQSNGRLLEQTMDQLVGAARLAQAVTARVKATAEKGDIR